MKKAIITFKKQVLERMSDTRHVGAFAGSNAAVQNMYGDAIIHATGITGTFSSRLRSKVDKNVTMQFTAGSSTESRSSGMLLKNIDLYRQE